MQIEIERERDEIYTAIVKQLPFKVFHLIRKSEIQNRTHRIQCGSEATDGIEMNKNCLDWLYDCVVVFKTALKDIWRMNRFLCEIQKK